LLKVAGLGPKAFEQAAGFLRIRDGEHPLDGSAVHPERYELVDRMAADLGCSVLDLLSDSAQRAKIQPQKYVTTEVGLPTLKDIVAELSKPGRDPRQQFEAFCFAEGVEKPEDLKPGMKLPASSPTSRLRRVRGHRRAPGRPRPHQPAQRSIREESRRCA
jgi:uncharacterized protein